MYANYLKYCFRKFINWERKVNFKYIFVCSWNDKNIVLKKDKTWQRRRKPFGLKWLDSIIWLSQSPTQWSPLTVKLYCKGSNYLWNVCASLYYTINMKICRPNDRSSQYKLGGDSTTILICQRHTRNFLFNINYKFSFNSGRQFDVKRINLDMYVIV